MITLNECNVLVESVDELPDFVKSKWLFMDHETRVETWHLDKKLQGLYPFGGDRVCGTSVTADDFPVAYYIPVRHRRGNNIPLPAYQNWLKAHVESEGSWINHNVIFDATFSHFDGAEPGRQLVDTLTLSKVHDSDRIGHGLKPLCREWCEMDMKEEYAVQEWLKQNKTKDSIN